MASKIKYVLYEEIQGIGQNLFNNQHRDKPKGMGTGEATRGLRETIR